MVGGILGVFFQDYLVIIGTCCAGGYNLVAGIGTLLGQFPIRDSGQPSWWFYMYIIGMSFATGGG